MKQILYALDGLFVGADRFAAPRLQLTTLSENGAGPTERDRSTSSPGSTPWSGTAYWEP